MNRYSYDINVKKGTTFNNHLILQKAIPKYDPSVHNNTADLQRTHAENIAYYGYTYEYIDVDSLYHHAELKIYEQLNSVYDPIFIKCSDKDNEIACTNTGITINLNVDFISELCSIADSFNYSIELCIDEFNTKVEPVICGKIFLL